MGVAGLAATTLYDAYQLGVEHSDVVDHKLRRAKFHLNKHADSYEDHHQISELFKSKLTRGLFNVETGMQQRWGMELDAVELLATISNSI